MNYTFIPIVQIRPNGLLQYMEVDGMRSGRSKQPPLPGLGVIQSHNVPAPATTYSGTLNQKAINRIKRCVRILAATAIWKEAYNPKTKSYYKWKVNFVTLTLPAMQGSRTDEEIKKQCFEPFLRKARQSFGMVSYVWRAERQKNGNIHFHIMTDTFFHHERLRRNWNKCVNKLGFVNEFEKEHGHRSPNSTDVHSVRKLRSLAAYIAKYMSKMDPEAIPLQGKCWDASKNIKNAKFINMIIEGEAETMWRKAVALYADQLIEFDFSQMVWLNEWQLDRMLPPTIKAKYISWLTSIRECKN